MIQSHRRLCASLMAAFVFAALGACSGGGSASSGLANPSANLTFTWPEGFTYDSLTGALYGPSAAAKATAPDYIASVTLTVFGEGMDAPITYNVPLDTLTITYALPPGPKTFTVTVITIYGQVFTASLDAELGAGFNLDLEFDLKVNAPPLIQSLAAGAGTSAKLGAQVTVTATDENDDPLSYQWSASGGAKVSGSGATVTVTASKSGTYTVTVIVSDGQGGTATASVNVTFTNTTPEVLSVTANPASPAMSENVALTCVGDDPDGDALNYYWTGTNGYKGSGASVTTTVGVGKVTSFTCEVYDGLESAFGSVKVPAVYKSWTGTLIDNDLVTLGLRDWSDAESLSISCSSTGDPVKVRIWGGIFSGGGNSVTHRWTTDIQDGLYCIDIWNPCPMCDTPWPGTGLNANVSCYFTYPTSLSVVVNDGGCAG